MNSSYTTITTDSISYTTNTTISGVTTISRTTTARSAGYTA